MAETMNPDSPSLKKDLLSILPLPELLSEQLSYFTLDSIRAKPVGDFDAAAASETLKRQRNQRVIAIDIGGDKVASASFRVDNGLLQSDSQEIKGIQSSDGIGYLQFLEELSQDATKNGAPVSISFAGLVEGTKPLAGPNISTLMKELADKYEGDFARLFSTLRNLSNDAVAGAIAGAIEARNKLPQTKQVIYVINGSGFGGAVIKDKKIFATEPGHIPVADKLNPFGQNKPCGIFGAQYVCVESVAASKAGIEDLWTEKTGEKLDGRKISANYIQGNELAINLYDNSALLTAHAIKGIANAFKILKLSNETAVVCHGGIFNVPGYGERVRQILYKNLGYQPSMFFTKDFSQNACLEGTAIAALATK